MVQVMEAAQVAAVAAQAAAQVAVAEQHQLILNYISLNMLMLNLLQIQQHHMEIQNI